MFRLVFNIKALPTRALNYSVKQTELRQIQHSWENVPQEAHSSEHFPHVSVVSVQKKEPKTSVAKTEKMKKATKSKDDDVQTLYYDVSLDNHHHHANQYCHDGGH